ncbi:MAG: sigma-70 family RNA polymerase sigma factor [Synechococcaceae cyanobacterium]|nr:sigma-70 family RNA polymerase sigma factor [Synechococcaceae cyanobacterium]
MACSVSPPGRPGRRPVTAAVARRNRRVEAYRALVRPIALHYAGCCPESCEDLIQVGLLGLIRAAELYRSERGVPFEAFARPHVRGAILHYLRDVAPTVRLPRRQAELQDRLRRLEVVQGAAAGGGSGDEALRLRLGISRSQWQRLLQARQLRRTCSLSDLAVEPAAWAPEPAPEEALPAGRVEAMLALLEERQRRVVRQVVLAGWSYRRLAAEMGVSPMTVQRLLRRGLERLRRHLDGTGLSPGDPGCRDASAAPAC